MAYAYARRCARSDHWRVGIWRITQKCAGIGACHRRRGVHAQICSRTLRGAAWRRHRAAARRMNSNNSEIRQALAARNRRQLAWRSSCQRHKLSASWHGWRMWARQRGLALAAAGGRKQRGSASGRKSGMAKAKEIWRSKAQRQQQWRRGGGSGIVMAAAAASASRRESAAAHQRGGRKAAGDVVWYGAISETAKTAAISIGSSGQQAAAKNIWRPSARHRWRGGGGAPATARNNISAAGVAGVMHRGLAQ